MRWFLCGQMAWLALLAAGCQTTIPSAPMQPVPMTPAAPAAVAPGGQSQAVPAAPGASSGPSSWAYTAPPPQKASPPAAPATSPPPLPESPAASASKPVQALPVAGVGMPSRLQKVQLAGPLVPVRPKGTAAPVSAAAKTATVQPLPPVEDGEEPRFSWPQEPIPVYPQTPY